MREFCGRIRAARFFGKLLTRFSTPEEILGPVDARSFDNPPYRRFTQGMLPEAEAAFLDETFNPNSSILNTLLEIVNEGVYSEGGTRSPVPLEIFVGASNRLPEGEMKEDLEAFVDRLVLRYRVEYLRRSESVEALLALEENGKETEGPRTTITLGELRAARDESRRVSLAPVRGHVLALWEGLVADGMRPSDRRLRVGYSLLRASAYLDGRSAANEEDLEVLGAVFWRDPDQIGPVADRVVRVAHPFKREAEDLLDEAEELLERVLGAAAERASVEARYEEARGDIERRARLREESERANDAVVAAVQDALPKLARKTDALLGLRSRAEATGRSTGRIDAVAAGVGRIKGEVRACVGGL